LVLLTKREQRSGITHIAFYMRALLFYEARHRVGEPFVGKPVEGVGRRGFEAALYFVLALGAGVEAFKPVFNAVVLSLVVAGFKVQQRLIAAAPPVSAKELLVVLKEQRSSHNLALLQGLNQK
jgi:hypothetical protein